MYHSNPQHLISIVWSIFSKFNIVNPILSKHVKVIILCLSLFNFNFSPSYQVTEWRNLMGFEPDAAKVYVDSWGAKRCFTHLLRRWLAGTVSPRVLLSHLWVETGHLLQIVQIFITPKILKYILV